MKKVSSLVILLLCAVISHAQYADVSKMPTIQVTGTAEINVVPDEVSFSLKVSKADKSLVTAKRLNDENVGKILALAKRFQLTPADVKTDFISVSEKFDRKKIAGTDDEYDNIFAGYAVSKTVEVKLKDLSKFEDFFSEVVKIGVTQISNVNFQSSQLRKYKDQARAMAMLAAREKAEAMTKQIGQTIGKAVSVEEKDIDGYR
ncbi:MAG TPA: SIMPL domain-containing protein, partial [Pyrinomonadaceae bacterium]|nr:SIMPL domain-containing protein [Pyrinomonadaceae bacterium]